jgi:raffinose/stachyose/melibiose transport system permease protein
MQDIIKTDVIEASFLDGASLFQCFSKVVAPISFRGAITAAIILVINSWNELLYALLLSQNDKSRTVQVAISSLVATYSANFPQAFAAMIIAILPMILIYIFLNKHIVAGLGMTVASK